MENQWKEARSNFFNHTAKQRLNQFLGWQIFPSEQQFSLTQKPKYRYFIIIYIMSISISRKNYVSYNCVFFKCMYKIQMITLCLLLILSSKISCILTTLYPKCVLEINQIPNSTQFTFVSCFKHDRIIEVASTWNQCTQKCCDSSITYPTNLDSFNACKEYHDLQTQKQDRQFKIIMSTFFGSLFLLFLVAGICQCRKKRKEDKQSRIFKYEQLTWFKSYKKVDEACQLCQQGGSNLKFACCKHGFHGQCWFDWHKGKNKCPSCQNKFISPLYVYCSKCFQQYFETRDQKLKKIPILTDQLCPECKKSSDILT